MCGEQSVMETHPQGIIGSPPRVRGTVQLAELHLYRTRITPACAGNSIPSGHMLGFLRDHPRVCGEQLNGSHITLAAEGSPPRVRGTGTATACRG